MRAVVRVLVMATIRVRVGETHPQADQMRQQVGAQCARKSNHDIIIAHGSRRQRLVVAPLSRKDLQRAGRWGGRIGVVPLTWWV